MSAKSLLAVAGVVALLTGCGTVTAGQPAPSDTSSRSSHSFAGTGVAASAGSSPAQLAAADAARLVASFTPPPGAVRLARSPVSLLTQPPMEVMTADQVIRSGWWRVPGQPGTILAWIRAHRPAGSTLDGSGGLGRPVGWEPPGNAPRTVPPPLDRQESYLDFGLAGVPGVLLGATVIAAVEADGNNTTAIGVYAEVLWQPARIPASLIPAAARIVTITPLNGHVAAAAGDHPVTVTDPAIVRRIAAIVDALPVEPNEHFIECGPTDGPGMQVTFRATAGGPALAVASGYQTLCEQISLVVDGKQMPGLASGETLYQGVMAAAGFHWSDFPAPHVGPTTPPAGS